MFKGKRLDWCLAWSQGCGQLAATAFCRREGFARAASFTADRHIGAKHTTRLLATGATCDLDTCDGFRQITCENTPLIEAVMSKDIHVALPRPKPPGVIPSLMAATPVPRPRPQAPETEEAAAPATPLPPAFPDSAPELSFAETTPPPYTPENNVSTQFASLNSSVALPVVAPPPQRFERPMYLGRRLDWCQSWDNNCGKPAADAFCKTNGFSRAKEFAPDPHIGDAQPTRVIASGAVCDQATCSGFRVITCAM